MPTKRISNVERARLDADLSAALRWEPVATVDSAEHLRRSLDAARARDADAGRPDPQPRARRAGEGDGQGGRPTTRPVESRRVPVEPRATAGGAGLGDAARPCDGCGELARYSHGAAVMCEAHALAIEANVVAGSIVRL